MAQYNLKKYKILPNKPLTIFAKRSISYVSQGFEYACEISGFCQ